MYNYEYISCNICNGDNTEPIFTTEDVLGTHDKFNIVKCLDCGLIYINPRPMKNEILKYYTSEYIPHLSKDSNLRNLSLNIYSKLFRYHIIGLEHYGHNRILDVGCGSGKFLEILNKKGWETFGVDISPVAVKNAKEKGLNVFEGELHDMSFSQEYFDVVIMRHSLEHMYDPKKEIEAAYKILRYNGILTIEVPNINCLESRIFREHWFQIDAPRHLYHFSEKTITMILKNANFDVVDIVQVAIPFSTISQSINYMTKLRFKKFFQNPINNLLLCPMSILESKILGQGPSILVRSIKR